MVDVRLFYSNDRELLFFNDELILDTNDITLETLKNAILKKNVMVRSYEEYCVNQFKGSTLKDCLKVGKLCL